MAYARSLVYIPTSTRDQIHVTSVTRPRPGVQNQTEKQRLSFKSKMSKQYPPPPPIWTAPFSKHKRGGGVQHASMCVRMCASLSLHEPHALSAEVGGDGVTTPPTPTTRR